MGRGWNAEGGSSERERRKPMGKGCPPFVSCHLPAWFRVTPFTRKAWQKLRIVA
jgi:hypothetical protein